jgi:hypothetical protein
MIFSHIVFPSTSREAEKYMYGVGRSVEDAGAVVDGLEVCAVVVGEVVDDEVCPVNEVDVVVVAGEDEDVRVVDDVDELEVCAVVVGEDDEDVRVVDDVDVVDAVG